MIKNKNNSEYRSILGWFEINPIKRLLGHYFQREKGFYVFYLTGIGNSDTGWSQTWHFWESQGENILALVQGKCQIWQDIENIRSRLLRSIYSDRLYLAYSVQAYLSPFLKSALVKFCLVVSYENRGRDQI